MEVKNLTIKFGEFTAVNNLSFDVHDGEIVGLLGPNGAGKTTTIKAIFGVVPYTGEISIKNSGKNSIGWMPQNSPLYLNLTVEENISFFATVYGIKNPQSRIEELLEFTNLKEYKKRLVKNLSGGMRQRLMLACSMVHKPKLLVLDEPTAGVDPPLRKSFWKRFERMNKEGQTILVTTHYMDEAENCHRLVLMRGGEKIADGSPDKIKKMALGGEVVHLSVSEPEKALNLLEREGYNVRLDEGINVIVNDAAESLFPIIETIRGEVKILSSETRKATLEEAFLRIIEE